MRTRRPAAITVAAGLLAVAAGTAGFLLTRQSTAATPRPPIGAGTVAAPASTAASPPANGPMSPGASPSSLPQAGTGETAKPVTLTIPLIGVRTTLITLGREADGSMEVPVSTSVAGWYTGSVLPGSVGPSVIAGHVDSKSGPGVFFRLPQLREGDKVYVTRADKSTAEFRVTEVQTYAKDKFPTQSVFGATPDPELRLITCGGTFDHATGHYLSNVVVYLTAVS
jgi:LPXTG-site transpeptidase (sortase) family protein